MGLSDRIPQGDANRPSVEIAIDLIYRASKYPLLPNKVQFDLPKVADIRLDVPNDENTFVRIIQENTEDDRLSGEGDDGFLYRRIPLTQLVPDPLIGMTLPEYPFMTYDILPQINAKLHVQFTEQDILNLPCTEPFAPIPIVANPDSLVWLGELTVAAIDLPENARILEEGTYRSTEDGAFRTLET